MKPFESKTIQGVIYADPELRRLAYERGQATRQRREAEAAAEAEREKDRPERLKAFWERLGYTPDHESDARETARRRLLAMAPAEAWIAEHPEVVNLETCPTMKELEQITRSEHRRLKASRARLSEMGVK